LEVCVGLFESSIYHICHPIASSIAQDQKATLCDYQDLKAMGKPSSQQLDESIEVSSLQIPRGSGKSSLNLTDLDFLLHLDSATDCQTMANASSATVNHKRRKI
jgi:hypothetical protein